MQSAKPKKLIEDFSIRLMYFLNTMDSFLPFAALFYLCLCLFLAKKMPFLVSFSAPLGWTLIFLIFCYALLKIGDFYPSFLIFTPLYFYLLTPLDPYWSIYLLKIASFMFIFTSLIQIIFMGIPMALASRRPDIPLRIYLNSFLILSPTTISLPLNVIYLTLLIYASKVIPENLSQPRAWIFLVVFALTALIVLKTKKKNLPLSPDHPISTHPLFKRVILLNIDGLSYAAFKKSQAGFLKTLEKEFCAVTQGARTIYRALTNPAFVSILTGTPSEIHGVKSNRFGQKIKVEALPDFISTRLYGSMHVSHFSRKNWDVKVFSLVELGYDKADLLMIEELKQDMLKSAQTQFWVVDLSRVDYAGHAWGSYSRKYYESIQKTDNLIKDFIQWLKQNNLLEETLIIISSDHGLFIVEHSFLLFKAEEFVPLIFVGKGIFPLEFSFPVSIMDICSNVSFALGKRYCRNDCGRVFADLFNKQEDYHSFQQRLAPLFDTA